jgi:hypothetical protein
MKEDEMGGLVARTQNIYYGNLKRNDHMGD